HVYTLLHVLMSSGIYYAPTLAVLNRSGNDSFLDQGAVNRVLIDLRGYLMLADDLFPGAHPLRDDFLAIVARERPLLQYGIFLSSHSTAAQWDASRDYLVRLGAWSGGLAFLRTLSPLLGPLYDHFMSIYRRIRYGVRA
ncbi:MAG TPA: hypothetical protein VFM34_08900, partial [Moraxellaceae bacterium]|nr:hypothetical protein [Moraxellaceae bacterium]